MAQASLSPFEKEVQIHRVPDTDGDTFQNSSPLFVVNGSVGIDGSLLLSQSTHAAYLTLPSFSADVPSTEANVQPSLSNIHVPFVVHTVQFQFLSIGNAKHPVTYTVTRPQTGKTFCVRNVSITQNKQLLAQSNVSFIRNLGRTSTMPEGKDKDVLSFSCSPKSMQPPIKRTATQPDDFDSFRTPHGPWISGYRLPISTSANIHPSTRLSRQYISTKFPIKSSGPLIHHLALIYMTDMYVVDSSLRIFDLHAGLSVQGDPIQNPEHGPDVLFMTSLNSTVRVHDLEGIRADRWLYMEVETTWARAGMVEVRGLIFAGPDEDGPDDETRQKKGRLVATVSQAAYIRLKKGIWERLLVPGDAGKEKETLGSKLSRI